ncbi:ribonuclease H1-like isoform X2 [Paramacrobiotus metropolitanus]|nr:ribonuclease H1-like isoform X2 [Paramacrobiotus metropolitanus]XP_055329306.1 ribonuclease H1-like isoform X2 [Paramacrobiotus metropolitanus]
MAPAAYYGVRAGKVPGVYTTWAECNAQVQGFPKCKFKKFKTREEAQQFVNGPDFQPSGSAANEGFDASSGGSSDYDADLNEPASSTQRKRPADFDRQHFLKGTGGFINSALSAPVGFVRHFSTSSSSCTTNAASPSPQHDPSRVGSVWVDGCCRNNGNSAALAGIGVFWEKDSPYNVAEPLAGRPSNQRAEICAAVRAVRQAKEQGMTKLIVHTDSNYLVQAMTEWLPNWLSNGWRSARGPVVNQEDFKSLLDTIKSSEVEIEWKHIRGHMGITGNEAADKLANEGALKGEKFCESVLGKDAASTLL